jgi:hypothetical protein
MAMFIQQHKKLVCESLNEMNFQKKMNNPLSAMGVGQIHIITQWLNEMGVGNYTINDNLTIDVKGDVNLNNRDLTKFPEFIRFNKVSGDFWCSGNNLVSLEGCPSSVSGDFWCSGNNLVSLEGCPEYVGWDFHCSNNNLVSLEGCPSSVGGDFGCSDNNLVSLEGCPSSVGGSFGCHTNNLVSLEGCPSSVSGDFWCARNNLISLKGCPTSVGGSFRCSNNPGKFTKEYVRKLCDVKGHINVIKIK